MRHASRKWVGAPISHNSKPVCVHNVVAKYMNSVLPGTQLNLVALNCSVCCRQATASPSVHYAHTACTGTRSLRHSLLLRLQDQAYSLSRQSACSRKARNQNVHTMCSALPPVPSFQNLALPGNAQVSWPGMFQIGSKTGFHSTPVMRDPKSSYS